MFDKYLYKCIQHKYIYIISLRNYAKFYISSLFKKYGLNLILVFYACTEFDILQHC